MRDLVSNRQANGLNPFWELQFRPHVTRPSVLQTSHVGSGATPKLVAQRASEGAQRAPKVLKIVPYRDLHVEQKRAQHLKQFVPHMMKFCHQLQATQGNRFHRGVAVCGMVYSCWELAGPRGAASAARVDGGSGGGGPFRTCFSCFEKACSDQEEGGGAREFEE